jgi:large subunit ribosomal protein L25
MATQVTLKADRREAAGKGGARKLRAQGGLPGVLYGAGADPVSISLDTHATEILFRSISVDNTIINLEVEGEKAPVPTLVREIQTHPARPHILHVDFLRIQMGVEVELDVPVHLEGTPAGVREGGGVLDHSIHELPVRCMPADIPESIVVDVTALDIGDAIHVADVAMPSGVEVLLDPDRTICSVQMPTKLEVEVEEVEEEGLEEGELEVEAEGEGEAEEQAEAAEESEGEEE